LKLPGQLLGAVPFGLSPLVLHLGPLVLRLGPLDQP
jgi:hypothetical protein